MWHGKEKTKIRMDEEEVGGKERPGLLPNACPQTGSSDVHCNCLVLFPDLY